MGTKLKTTKVSEPIVDPTAQVETANPVPATDPTSLTAVTGELKSFSNTAPLVPAELGNTFMIGSVKVADQRAALDLIITTANLLKEIMESRQLYTTFYTTDKRSGAKIPHNHPHVEAWQALAMLLGCTVRELESKYVYEMNGFESRAEVIRLIDGMRIGEGSGFCDFSEAGKDKAYAVKSMSMTRAISKAIKNMFGHIMKVAGFQPTPKEEIEDLGGSPLDGFSKDDGLPHQPDLDALMDAAQKEIYDYGLLLKLSKDEVDAIFVATYNDDFPPLPDAIEVYKATLHLAVKEGRPITKEEVAAFMLQNNGNPPA